MGRKKLEIKRIAEKTSRQVAFCKRRKGLLKKARELSILCDADVAAVVISNHGRLYEFCSSSSLTGILQRYESHCEAEKEMADDTEHSKYSRFMTMRELLQTIERRLEKTDVDGLTVSDLVHLENQLQNAIMQVRSRKTHLVLESVKDLHEKQEKLLREENKLLEDEIAKKKKEVNEMVTNLPPANMNCGQRRTTLNLLH